jgi:iron complex outermembrane receptor protein
MANSFYSTFIVLTLSGFFFLNLQGQADTVLSIPTVQIEAETIRYSNLGGQEVRWSDSDLDRISSGGLPELLQTEGVYIKSYGLGSLATSSIRGGSAGHTSVLWNGIPVSSPMLGQLDLSLLPLSAFSQVSLQRGGGSTNWGSGAIGGVIQLQNSSSNNAGFEGSYESVVGDFGRIRQAISIRYGDGKFSGKTSFEYREARNDFSYPIAVGFPERQQTNAELFQRLFTQDITYRVNPQQKVTLNFWHQNSYREIPPASVQSRSTAFQEDESNRILMGYSFDKEAWSVSIKAAYFDENLFYADPRILLESPSAFQTLTVDGSAEYRLHKRHTFLLGQTYMRTEAETDNYNGEMIEERAAVFGLWKFNGHALNLQGSVRQEVVDGRLVVPLPSFAAEYEVLDNLNIKGKVSRNFRLPTLNDRFWVPGGNPDLKAESGWSQEATIDYSFFVSKVFIELSQTLFNRTIDNWIMWSPGETGFWAASNVASVWSHGSESRVTARYRSKSIYLQLDAGYDRVSSTNQGELDVAGMDVGEQLLYTPEELAFISMKVKWKGLSLTYRHNYTDEARGVNEPIPAFHTADLRLEVNGKPSAASSIRSSFFFDVMNLYNAEYVVIDRRPMPGINFQAGFRFNFSKPT